MLERLFTVGQVAHHLSVSKVTIRRMIRAGRIKSTRFGAKLIRIRESDLEDFLKGDWL